MQGRDVRWYLVFHGRVQSVGFRYTAKRAADRLGLTGWVRNRDDGTVEMEVQGPRERIEQLLRTFDDDRYIRVTELEQEIIPTVAEETGFYARR